MTSLALHAYHVQRAAKALRGTNLVAHGVLPAKVLLLAARGEQRETRHTVRAVAAQRGVAREAQQAGLRGARERRGVHHVGLRGGAWEAQRTAEQLSRRGGGRHSRHDAPSTESERNRPQAQAQAQAHKQTSEQLPVKA